MARRAMTRFAPVLVAALLWGGQPGLAETASVQPGGIGQIAGTVGSRYIQFTTYDFSRTTVDLSAWIERRGQDSVLHIVGYPNGNPAAVKGLLNLSASFHGKVREGAKTRRTLVELFQTDDPRDARLSSVGQVATVEVLSVTRPSSGLPFARVSGRVLTTFCQAHNSPAKVDKKSCAPLALEFSTRVKVPG